MCGICGFVNLNGKPASEDILDRMNRALVHRGPDDSGKLLDGNVAMAMRRLSIQDVEGGHQPISNEDQTIWIVFNGEIYNSPELRDQLLNKGHRFATRSDTEAIVHQYEDFGERCVDGLRGMFAFALLDKRNGEEAFRFFIARDRLGIKPLYYYFDNDLLVFSSELTGLVQHPGVAREIEPRALYHYLATGIVAAPLTMFRNVRQLMPGQAMSLENGQLSFSTYWQLPEVENTDVSDQDAAKTIRQMLEQSVREHLLSDVPVGAFLSGGIDSSTIVALMARTTEEQVLTFSIRFEEDGYDESRYARMVAEKYRTNHREFTVRNRGFNESLLRSVITHHGQPTADSSAIPTYIVSSLARKYVKVVLSGDGGDECFAGYSHYGWLKKIEHLYLIPRFLRQMILGVCRASASIPFLSQCSRLRQLINALLVSLAPRSHMPFEVLRLNRDSEIDHLLSADWKFCTSGQDDLFDYMDSQAGSVVDRGRRFSFRYFLPDAYLPKVDRMSMAASLEVRVPFLDHRLVEFALSLPGERHWKGGVGKRLLRAAAIDLLPEEIFSHKKQGFSIPLHSWTDEKYFQLVEELLSEEAVAQRGIFNVDAVRQLVERCRGTVERKAAVESDYRLSHRLFQLVVLELWCQMYLDDLVEQPVQTDMTEILAHA